MSHDAKLPVIPAKFILSFILVTTLFSLWGFANDITNPLVAAFKDVFVINNAQSSWVQMAFYGGYGTMAIPAALFIRRFSYKSGIILGLALYAIGAIDLRAGRLHGEFQPLPAGTLHPHLRARIFGDHREPLHPLDGAA